MTKAKSAEDITPVTEHLASNGQALSLNPVLSKNPTSDIEIIF
jgi:hypothetical protein